ncbi:hypothetical protein [Azonexus sp.]|uniref:hypothetical protein n=1 Tax=Azonexus sp. TaxID=1872668 RepID=UPI0039E2D361
MSSFGYLHGAGVQEMIDAARFSSDIDRVNAAWMETARVLKARIAERDAAIKKLNYDLDYQKVYVEFQKELLQTARTDEQKARSVLAQREKEYKIMIDELSLKMSSEALDLHDEVIDWVCKYGENQSHEFIEGLRHLFKSKMPMSQSESLRQQFIEEFEAKAKAMACENEKNGKGYFVDEEALLKASNIIAKKMVIQEHNRIRNALSKITGSNLDIGAGRFSEKLGPEEIAQAVGEGKFKLPEEPMCLIYKMHYLPSHKASKQASSQQS